jgi:predicted helicase
MNYQDQLINTCISWESFWDVLLKGLGNGSAGDLFERFTQFYLQIHPEYRIKLKHVWRCPEEVPAGVRERLNLPTTDEGIDLVAETRDGAYWAIQCKFRSDTTKPLTYSELSTFSTLSFVNCRGISLGIVAHTSAKPVRKRKLLGEVTEITYGKGCQVRMQISC